MQIYYTKALVILQKALFVDFKVGKDITSDQPILSRPKMAPQLKLPGTQAKCTEGPFWTQLEYTEGPFWTKLECTEGPFWLSKAV